MSKSLLSLLTFALAFPSSAMAQAASGQTVDEMINEAVAPAANALFGIIFYPVFTIQGVAIPFILIWLLGGAIFFTIYLGFINIRGFGHAIDIIKGKYTHAGDVGEVTHFQALTAALSGTVGLGNIAGVAVAISMGGPGATFWMIIAGLLGMSSKFTECALAVRFRNVHADGSISGGPMHYLRKGLRDKGMAKLGAFLAMFFAIMCIGASFGGGNMFQVNQAAQQFIALPGISDSFLADSTWVFGLVMAILVGIVIIGGIQSIAKVTEKIVPFMGILYVTCALVVLAVNYHHIPQAFLDIFNGAMNGKAVGGGIIGVLIVGMQRATFSNEAGVGSAAIAHSAVKTSEPVTEGFVASLEPFVDTVVVCTMTALVIVISDVYKVEGTDGIALTSNAFATVIDWFPLLLTLAVVLFAFSTMISWSYYGLKAWSYIFGESNMAVISYKFIFCVFIVIGASASLDSVILFSDAMLFAMSFPNILGLYILAPLVKSDMNSFLSRVKKGNIETFEGVK